MKADANSGALTRKCCCCFLLFYEGSLRFILCFLTICSSTNCVMNIAHNEIQHNSEEKGKTWQQWLSALIKDPIEIEFHHWGRCGRLIKLQYFSSSILSLLLLFKNGVHLKTYQHQSYFKGGSAVTTPGGMTLLSTLKRSMSHTHNIRKPGSNVATIEVCPQWSGRLFSCL